MATSKQGNDDKDSGNKQSGGDTSNRGFASMDPEKQRAIASEGGKAAHASGHAHEFDSEEAREAGRMSHKNDGNQQSSGGGSSGGGSQGSKQSGSGGGESKQSSTGTRGGTSEQHAQAGRQSHKNDKNDKDE